MGRFAEEASKAMVSRTRVSQEMIAAAKKKLQVDQVTFGMDNYKTSDAMQDLALLYIANGQFAEAKPLCERAYEIDLVSLGPDHHNLTLSLKTLGLFYGAQGHPDLAEPFFEKALEIMINTVGPNHYLTASTRSALSSVYRAQGKHEMANMMEPTRSAGCGCLSGIIVLFMLMVIIVAGFIFQ